MLQIMVIIGSDELSLPFEPLVRLAPKAHQPLAEIKMISLNFC